MTKAASPRDLLDLSGRVVIVTGAGGGGQGNLFACCISTIGETDLIALVRTVKVRMVVRLAVLRRRAGRMRCMARTRLVRRGWLVVWLGRVVRRIERIPGLWQ